MSVPDDDPDDSANDARTLEGTDVGWGEAPDVDDERDAHERWLYEQRPPHWD